MFSWDGAMVFLVAEEKIYMQTFLPLQTLKIYLSAILLIDSQRFINPRAINGGNTEKKARVSFYRASLRAELAIHGFTQDFSPCSPKRLHNK